MEQLSLAMFGTPDYQSVLSVMAPSDELVKDFEARCTAAGFLDQK